MDMQKLTPLKYVNGDLIQLAKEGHFNVITHGCNCFNRMKRGIAPQMAKAFGCDKFHMETDEYLPNCGVAAKDLIEKLGNIDWKYNKEFGVIVVNSYTQFHYHTPSKYGIPLDYDALRMCMRKLNILFKGLHIGLPKIGCGLGGRDRDWETEYMN